MSDRIIKINELIHSIIGELLEREVSWKQGVLVTVARVDTAPNLRYTRVFVSVFPETETRYALETLRHEEHALEQQLRSHLATRPLPKLGFALDTGSRELDTIEKILKQIHAESDPHVSS